MGSPGQDFLSIELEDGRVVGKYDLGSGTGVLRSSGPVERYNDGQWHDLYMNRIGNDGLLKIDNLSGDYTFTSSCHVVLTLCNAAR